MDEIVAVLRSYKLPFGEEQRLQDAVEEALREHKLEFRREHILRPGDRIDFLVGTIGIECKVEGSPAAVLSQLLRYAESNEVDGLILVTTRNTHRMAVTELGGKPFHLIRVSGL